MGWGPDGRTRTFADPDIEIDAPYPHEAFDEAYDYSPAPGEPSALDIVDASYEEGDNFMDDPAEIPTPEASPLR